MWRVLARVVVGAIGLLSGVVWWISGLWAGS
jgi:hypothetical protein